MPTKKIFQMDVSFIEPTKARITLSAESEEDAIARVKAELAQQGVQNLVIDDVTEVTQLVDETKENVIDLQTARAN